MVEQLESGKFEWTAEVSLDDIFCRECRRNVCITAELYPFVTLTGVYPR